MTYDITQDGKALRIKVEGPLNYKTSPEIEEALKGKLDEVTDLTVDLEGTNYVSSMGLRLLLSLQKRMFKQGSMRVINVGQEVRELFDATGFSQVLDVQP
jgi:anti-sigma B factor antagonist